MAEYLEMKLTRLNLPFGSFSAFISSLRFSELHCVCGGLHYGIRIGHRILLHGDKTFVSFESIEAILRPLNVFFYSSELLQLRNCRIIYLRISDIMYGIILENEVESKTVFIQTLHIPCHFCHMNTSSPQNWTGLHEHQGPVVQSIVSLTSSLRGQLVKCFTTL